MDVIGQLYADPNKPKAKAEPRKLHSFLNYERYRSLVEFSRLKETATAEGWRADCPQSSILIKEVAFEVKNKLLQGRGFDPKRLRKYRDLKGPFNLQSIFTTASLITLVLILLFLSRRRQ